jgi:serine/threonine protein kinase
MSVCDGIVRCYGITRDPITKDYMIVLNQMKYDLHEYIEKYRSTITWPDINKLCMDITFGLSYIHKEGLVHRDLHPGNVLRERLNNNWCIADLGLSGPPDQTNKVYGNLPYLAPELLTEKKYSAQSDIYAFGMLLYYITTFKSPFAGLEHDASLQISVVRGDRPIIPEETPKEYKNIIQRSWDANPNKRPKAGVISNVISIATKIKRNGLVLQNVPAEADSEITSGISANIKSFIYDIRDSFRSSSTQTSDTDTSFWPSSTQITDTIAQITFHDPI